MKTGRHFSGLCPALLAVSLFVLFGLTGCHAAVPDQRLVGQWRGTNLFHGVSYREIVDKQVTNQLVAVALVIAADGQVTGHIGGAELTNCVCRQNRGWLGRKLNIETDFIIRGQITGQVVPASEAGTHEISAPFNLKAGRISGTVFVQRNFTYPYPILGMELAPGP
jgi:hypothetical protein